jgi:signal transduction histidine kinase
MSELRAVMSSIERCGAWEVPQHLDIRVKLGNAELDLREAQLAEGTTTFDVDVNLGNLEIILPEDLAVEVDVSAFAGSVEEASSGNVVRGGRKLRITGRVKFGSVELSRGGERDGDFCDAPADRRARRERHRDRRRARWKEIRAERELWMRERKQHWVPWWMHARMRRRIFTVMAIALAAGVLIGLRVEHRPAWWQIGIGFIALSMISGAIAWRMTRPLIMVVRAARDIGDGKLDTRINVGRHAGETRVLAVALNEMAGKIQQQLADQRQLLAAVSHELRTPLGHMRVMIETARDTGDRKSLDELEREVLVLDDLVGKLLASSRLEFGNLERRPLDLGEAVTDAATTSGVAPEAIEASGDVRARVDPTLLRRAVANLIDNARVHGGGVVAVRIERRAGQVAIEVDDAGPGVPADRRADAFRAFVPSSGGGLGLGLALVSRIAVAHGGGAWIADRPGGGARVGFTVAAA